MTTSPGKFSAMLASPDEYIRHLNQVVGVTPTEIVFLKRKFASRAGWELVRHPMSECERIAYKDERPILVMTCGALLVALMAYIGYMLFVYWDSLETETRVPIGLLMLAAGYGLRWAFFSRRHKVVFLMRDGKRLIYKSRSGDYNLSIHAVRQVIEFSKSKGLMYGAE